MPEIEERVGVVEEKVQSLEAWRSQHCIDATHQIEALAKLPAEIAVLAAQVALLVGTQGNLWQLVKWLSLALIAMAAAAWGIREIIPMIAKGGL